MGKSDSNPPPAKKQYNALQTVHSLKPDYTRPRLQVPEDKRERIVRRLRRLYGEETAERYWPELERVMKVYYAHKSEEMIEREAGLTPEERFSERDVILITYGDLLRSEGLSPLAALARFCDSFLKGTINTLHILPFFPYSSDRGFSVVDFETVDRNLGTWADIEKLEGQYQLMFDGVINHASSGSRWFQEYLNDRPYYRDFFTGFDSPNDLTPEHRAQIFRPRTSDILTRFESLNGPKYVWTTFSEDQIDLNFKSPDVLVRVTEILLYYVRRGADIIRLDAVTYLWAELGTQCANLEETHEIVRLLRDVLDTVAPGVALITETNVPHEDNISYFGDGSNEAQMVYNFALPPLVLHAFYRQDSTVLSRWAAGLRAPSDTTTFFNFLDSHDGIGLMAVRDLLPREEIDFVLEKAREHGARISCRSTVDGGEEPYEINLTWFSALSPGGTGEDMAFRVKRFVASRIVALMLQGVPGIYLHSMIGTENDIEAVLATATNRAINRSVIDEEAIMEALADPLSKISRINREFGRLIAIRTRQRAFHPNGPQRVLDLSPDVFALVRESPEGDQTLLCLVNITDSVCSLDIDLEKTGCDATAWHDLVSDVKWMAEDGALHLALQPYDVAWLEAQR